MKTISLAGCAAIGEGAGAVTYSLPTGNVVKVFRPGITQNQIFHEYACCQEAFRLGVPTAKVFDMVHTESGIGIVFEKLESVPIGEIIENNPDKLEPFARSFGVLLRNIHQIKVKPEGIFPDAIQNELVLLERISRFFDNDIIDISKKILLNLPSDNSLLHLDLNTRNIMLKGNELRIIDLGGMAYGNPLLDLAYFYSPMKYTIGDHKTIVGMSKKNAWRFSEVLTNEYFKDVPSTEKNACIQQIEALSLVRGLTWITLLEIVPGMAIRASERQFRKRYASLK